MLKLYEIAEQLKTFEQMVDDGIFEDETAITDTLESIKMDFDQKIENIACLYKSLISEADALGEEAAKLIDRAKRKQKTAEWLKNYMTWNLESIGQKKLETAKCSISFRKSESLNITNENELYEYLRNNGMDEFATTTETVKFDKKAIKQAIKDGAEITGAEVLINNNLQIK